MTEKTIDLDQRRGTAAQKAAVLAEVGSEQREAAEKA